MRKTFTVDDPSSISSAVLRVNADDADMTYVNGTQSCPARRTRHNGWQISQVNDIKSLLVDRQERDSHRGHRVRGQRERRDRRGQHRAGLDADRHRRELEGACAGHPPRRPPEWNTIGFDDSSWPAADVQGAYGIRTVGQRLQAPVPPARSMTSGSPPQGGPGSRCRRPPARRSTSATPRSSTPTEPSTARAPMPRPTPTSSRAAARRPTSRSTAGRATDTSRSGPRPALLCRSTRSTASWCTPT